MDIEENNNNNNIVNLSKEQIKIMSIEIGELLGNLKDKSVCDFYQSLSIILIDRSTTKLIYDKTQKLRIKRFTSLIRKYLTAFQYLVKHLTYDNNVKEVERIDRIMGSIDFRKTISLNNKGQGDKAICLEIHKNFHTPENTLLTIIILSIISYCDKYIKLEGLVESSRFNPTISDLKIIQLYLSKLLLLKNIRSIIPNALDSISIFDDLLNLTIKRIKNQKDSRSYIPVIKLFYEWKYLISIFNVSIWKWIQKYRPKRILTKRKKIDEFIVDETLIKIGSGYVWLWVAIEPKHRQSFK